VIMFELLNGLTPFHSTKREEFEAKVERSDYCFKDSVVPFLTIEALSFISQTLQHNELERKEIHELINHPYIMTSYADQHKLQSHHLGSVFIKPKTDLLPETLKKQDKKKRASSLAPPTMSDKLMAGLNAKDKVQAKKIDMAFNELLNTQASTNVFT
jgi:serine/threonine protein kinase